MEIKKTSQKGIKNRCSVVISGNNIELTESSLVGKSPEYVKYSKNIWINKETGEYVEKVFTDKSKLSNIKSVRNSVKSIRRLINCNFFGDKDEYFITLTYAENMTDVKRLYLDLNKFIKKLKYRFPDLLYINVIEPQERGAWHCHILLKNVDVIDNDYIFSLWKHGFTYCSSVIGIENVGAYISAYLTNTKDKKYARLHMYPQNLKILRHSKNCKQPERLKMWASEFLNTFHNLRLKYVDSYQVLDNNRSINRVVYRSYVKE